MTTRPRRSGNPSAEGSYSVAPEDVAGVSPYVPPDWRKPWHRSADLGYPDYLPPRPGHDEEEMRENLVKNGFQGRSLLSSSLETFNAHSLIHDGFAKHGQIHLHMLGQLMHDVAVRQAEWRPKIGPSTFKLPAKVTVHNSKRDAWIADLANSQVPLSKLASGSIPHPFKGHDLLEMLYSNKIPVDRAIWYVRVLGAYETQMMRSRPNFKPSQYSIDWANIMTTYLKKQLGEVVLPSAYRPGLTIRQSFQGVLGDLESRAKWTTRFAYSLALLREFFAESLVDHATFLLWLSQLISTSNLAQLGLVALLVDEYLEGITENRAFLAPLIEGCLNKFAEIDSNSSKELLLDVHKAIGNILQKSFLSRPDCFVLPKLWYPHINSLRTLLLEKPGDFVSTFSADDPKKREVFSAMREAFHDIAARNDAISFRSLPARAAVSLRLTMVDIQLLNSINPTVIMGNIRYFETGDGAFPDLFRRKLRLLLTWGVTAECGGHKYFAVASILYHWRERAKHRKIVRHPREFLHNELFEWLDTSDIARNRANHLDSTALLYEELVRRGLFSYTKFIQKLIARGEIRGGGGVEPRDWSHLSTMLYAIPISSPTESAFAERAAALYGVDFEDPQQSPEAAELQVHWQKALPEIFSDPDESPGSEEPLRIPKWKKVSPFDQFQLIHRWLLPEIYDYVDKRAPDQEPLSAKSYCLIVRILAQSRCYPAILKLSTVIIERTSSKSLMLVILDTMRIHSDVWSSMDVVDHIVQIFSAVQESCESRGIPSKALLVFLRDIHEMKQLNHGSESHFLASPAKTQPQPGDSPMLIPELTDFIRNPSTTSVSSLASTLITKYGIHDTWLWSLWDNVVANIDQVCPTMPESSAQREAVIHLAELLHELDGYLTEPLDHQTIRWLDARGNARLLASGLNARAWELLSLFILHLVSKGILSATTVLNGLIFVGWVSPFELAPDAVSLSVIGVNDIARRLLLPDEEPSEGDLPPRNPSEVQRFLGQRSAFFRPHHLAKLFSRIADLIRLELRDDLSSAARSTSTHLRLGLCSHPYFRLLALRQIDDAREVFCKPATKDSVWVPSDAKLTETLKLLIGPDETSEVDDPPAGCDIPTIMTRMTPWNFSRAMVELQLTFRRIGLCLSHESTRAQAEAYLSTFTTSFLEHALDPEETDLVADVLRGLSGFVADQFLSSGFQRLAQLLGDLLKGPIETAVDSFLRKSGELLRLLASAFQPLRNSGSTLPLIAPMIQDDFSDRLQACFNNVLTMLKGRAPPEIPTLPSPLISPHPLPELLLLLARLLQFNLGFRGAWTAKFQGAAESKLALLVEIIVVYCSQSQIEGAYGLFTTLLDTAAMLMADIPRNPKSANQALFTQLPNVDFMDLPSAMPSAFRSRLAFILRYNPTDVYAAHLYQARRVPNSTRLILGEPVIAKPWEWIEFTAPPLQSTSSGSGGGMPRQGSSVDPPIVPNNSSISLEHFGIKLTGERLRGEEERKYDRVAAELRNGEDRFHGESMFERDWRDARVTWTGREKSNEHHDVAQNEDVTVVDEDGVGSPEDLEYQGGILRMGSPAPSQKTTSSGLSASARTSSKGKSTKRTAASLSGDGSGGDIKVGHTRKRRPEAASTSSSSLDTGDSQGAKTKSGRMIVEVVIAQPSNPLKRKSTADSVTNPESAPSRKQGKSK